MTAFPLPQRERRGARRQRAIAGSAALVIFAGTAGFIWIEGWGLREAFYMTVITLSTVGFGEVRPLSEAGRMFTAILILGGVTTLGFALHELGDRLVRERGRRHLRRIHRMTDHTIICSGGRIARPVVEGLIQQGREFVVIEKSAEKAAQFRERGVAAIAGDATAEEVLIEAGLPRAKAIAALLPSDADNLSIAMTAHALNQEIRIVARSEDERSRANLVRAGAASQDVVSPYTTAGKWVLHNLSGVHMSRVFEGIEHMVQQGFDAARLQVTPGSKHDGLTLSQAAINLGRNVLVLTIQHEDGGLVFAPTGDYRIRANDALILIGRSPDLEELGATTDRELVNDRE